MAYQSPLVRHLAWSLFSEPIAHLPNTRALTIEPSSELTHWLKQLDENPQPLAEYLENNNARLLGSYFECLWQYFFENAPGWQLLAHHFQVFDHTQTLGELDILARDAKQQAWHIELAVKFYLLPKDFSGEEMCHWIGPQSHDRLDKKIDKLTNKQLPFIHAPQTLDALQSQNLPSTYQQALVVKGYLFQHISNETIGLHCDINTNVHLGKWLHANECGALLHNEASWVVIPKLDWLGEYSTAQKSLPILNNSLLSEAIQTHFDESPYPYALMVVKLDSNQENEIERFLVVHNQWPIPLKKLKKTN